MNTNDLFTLLVSVGNQMLRQDPVVSSTPNVVLASERSDLLMRPCKPSRGRSSLEDTHVSDACLEDQNRVVCDLERDVFEPQFG